MSVKPLITAADYNNIRNKVDRILGTGVGSEGYGQSLQSQTVNPLSPPPNDVITAEQWNTLRNDIITIRQHQIGESGNVPTVTKGATIRSGISNPVNGFDLILDQLAETRFNVGSNRVSIIPRESTSFTGTWSRSAVCTLTIEFATSDFARYFFNSGGQIRFNSSRSGGSITPQNNAWSQVLISAGPRTFGGNLLDPINFYTLTDEYQTFFIFSASTPYSANSYRLSVKSNRSNNSQGAANIVQFEIRWQDNYIDPDTLNPDFPGTGTIFDGVTDEVDGTLSVTIEEIKESIFLITSPMYSISSITVDLEE
jgi:hypothetical protein